MKIEEVGGKTIVVLDPRDKVTLKFVGKGQEMEVKNKPNAGVIVETNGKLPAPTMTKLELYDRWLTACEYILKEFYDLTQKEEFADKDLTIFLKFTGEGRKYHISLEMHSNDIVVIPGAYICIENPFEIRYLRTKLVSDFLETVDLHHRASLGNCGSYCYCYFRHAEMVIYPDYFDKEQVTQLIQRHNLGISSDQIIGSYRSQIEDGIVTDSALLEQLEKTENSLIYIPVCYKKSR